MILNTYTDNMSEKKEQNIRVINLASYQTPVVKEEYNKEWVSYGENNDYFQELIERYLGLSLIHI